MHLMTAAILKNRMLTACSSLVLMNSDLPEDLPLHQSRGSGLGLLGLQRDHSPEGSCSSLLSCEAAIRKTLGALPACLQGRPLTSAGAASPRQGAVQHHGPSASPTSPATWAQLGGHTPALGKGIPAVRRAASGPLSLPTAGGCCTKEQGLCFGWLGRCTGTKVTTKLCPAWPSMNGFANVGL